MAPRDAYRAQVELLIRCLPAVASAPDFAIKGGTAINLFLTTGLIATLRADPIRQAFVAYLAAHRRPIAELLAPNRKLIEDLFANHFAGMTDEAVELAELEAELEAARTQLFEWASTALTENERRFLLSIKQGEPDWTLLPFEGLDQWPAIQWKLYNVRRMSPRSHKKALGRLRDILEI